MEALAFYAIWVWAFCAIWMSVLVLIGIFVRLQRVRIRIAASIAVSVPFALFTSTWVSLYTSARAVEVDVRTWELFSEQLSEDEVVRIEPASSDTGFVISIRYFGDEEFRHVEERVPIVLGLAEDVGRQPLLWSVPFTCLSAMFCFGVSSVQTRAERATESARKHSG